MTFELTNQISSHQLTFMPANENETFFGWIELIKPDGNSAGFIYLRETVGSHVNKNRGYIVTSVPFTMLETMLSILRNERGMQIRYHDPEVAGILPSVFIEKSASNVETQNLALQNSL